MKVYDNVCKFVKEEKKLPKGLSSVAVIKEASADPLFKTKLACFASITKGIEGFFDDVSVTRSSGSIFV